MGEISVHTAKGEKQFKQTKRHEKNTQKSRRLWAALDKEHYFSLEGISQANRK